MIKQKLYILIYFNSIDRAISWAYALEYVAKSSNKNRLSKHLCDPIDSSSGESRQMIEQVMINHLENLGLDSKDIDDRLVRLSAKKFSRLIVATIARPRQTFVMTTIIQVSLLGTHKLLR